MIDKAHFFRAAAAVGLLAVATVAHGDDFQHDYEQAARGLGYADFVFQSGKCPEARDIALSLRTDIAAYYGFTASDIAGETEIGKSIAKGRANARKDARFPREFCERQDEVLGLWRSEVLPSPR
jgi:hypothetical protein